MYDIDQQFVKKYIEAGNAKPGPTELSNQVDHFVSQNFEWEMTGYRIKWDDKRKKIAWVEESEEAVERFILDSCLKDFEYICVVYAAREPCLIVKLSDLAKDLDVLMAHGIDTRFLVGIKRLSGVDEYELELESFIEVDGNRWLTCSK